MKCQGWKHTSSAAGLPGEEGDAGEDAPGAPWPGEAGRTAEGSAVIVEKVVS